MYKFVTHAENHFTKVPDNLTQNKHENNKDTTHLPLEKNGILNNMPRQCSPKSRYIWVNLIGVAISLKPKVFRNFLHNKVIICILIKEDIPISKETKGFLKNIFTMG